MRGTVNLTTIALAGTVGFTAGLSNQFTIINNDGTDAVTGTFTDLPQNASVTFGDYIFRVSYTGGTGNDVMLTKIGDVYWPVLSIQQVPPASVRLLWATSAPPFRLQSNTNLNTTNWASVTPSPTVVGTNNLVTNAVSGTQNFYRLVSP